MSQGTMSEREEGGPADIWSTPWVGTGAPGKQDAAGPLPPLVMTYLLVGTC